MWLICVHRLQLSRNPWDNPGFVESVLVDPGIFYSCSVVDTCQMHNTARLIKYWCVHCGYFIIS